jgi:cysteine desulfurase / selenocysteine lyase
MSLDVRADFPALAQSVHGQPLVYLDSAATSQKPNSVIDAIARFYREDCANVHRGAHALSERASASYEAARERVASFIGAEHVSEVLFTSGTTDAVSFVADALRRRGLQANEQIVVTALEHHSNFVPWQRLCSESGARLVVVPVNARGQLDLEHFERALGEPTRLVAFAHASNVLGNLHPVAALCRLAREHAALSFIDGAQAVPHLPVDVAALGCDFYAFSAHKAYGPFGIGALYAKQEQQRWLAPYRVGGGMVERVTELEATYADAPARYEAGTPDIAGAVGLAAALDYLGALDLANVAAHARELVAYAREQLAALPGVRVLGEAQETVGIVSFVLDGIHAHDVGTVLDQQGVAVRVGQHCAQPLMRALGVPATVRASFGVYSQPSDVDALTRGLVRVRELFAR